MSQPPSNWNLRNESGAPLSCSTSHDGSEEDEPRDVEGSGGARVPPTSVHAPAPTPPLRNLPSFAPLNSWPRTQIRA